MSQSKVSKIPPAVVVVLLVWGADVARHHQLLGPWAAVAREAKEASAAVWPRTAANVQMHATAEQPPANVVDATGMTAEERAGATNMFRGLDSIDRSNDAKIRTLSREAVDDLRDPGARARIADALTASPTALRVTTDDGGPPKGGGL
jgi:hypothetical protein